MKGLLSEGKLIIITENLIKFRHVLEKYHYVTANDIPIIVAASRLDLILFHVVFSRQFRLPCFEGKIRRLRRSSKTSLLTSLT